MMGTTILSLLLLLPALLFFSTNLPIKNLNTLSSVRKTSYVAVVSALIGSLGALLWITQFGVIEMVFFNFQKLGLSIRIDSLSIIMYTMISIIALVVIRFSGNYLEGDPRHQQFYSKLAFTIAFVQLLVLSGNLATILIAWIGTSIGLHRLLLFYPERKKARLAAKKKFIVARLGDASLLTAFILIYLQFGNGNLGYIFEQLKQLKGTEVPIGLETAAFLLVLSASLKSVQVPFHGWLLNVMETPTPVSALLHAGLLNAGPFLIIRFAFLMDLASNAAMLLVLIGAASALFGAIVSATQPAIKTALAYSSIGHMGFSLMVCGFGVYSASLLHLVAHSFYKAHAFLSSGSLIEKVQTKNASEHVRLGKGWRILLGLLTTSVIYGSISYFWGINQQTEFQLLVIGAIIFFGILSLQINSFDSNNGASSIIGLIIGAGIVINLFFFFEATMHYAISSQVPSIPSASSGLIALSIGILVVFLLVILLQALPLSVKNGQRAKAIEVHFRNGLYFNHLFDKVTGSLSRKTQSNSF